MYAAEGMCVDVLVLSRFSPLSIHLASILVVLMILLRNKSPPSPYSLYCCVCSCVLKLLDEILGFSIVLVVVVLWFAGLVYVLRLCVCSVLFIYICE